MGAPIRSLEKKPGLRLRTMVSMYRALRELRPDVLHTHQIAPLFYTGPAARALGIPVVHTEHGLPLVANRIRDRWLARLAGIHCDLFFCLTHEIAEHVRQYRIVPGRKIRTIRNGIDLTAYRVPGDPQRVRQSLGIPADARVIGTVGRLAEIKRYDLLIRS